MFFCLYTPKLLLLEDGAVGARHHDPDGTHILRVDVHPRPQGQSHGITTATQYRSADWRPVVRASAMG